MTALPPTTAADTLLVHAGRDPERYGGMVNPPVFRGSTILYPSMDALLQADSNWHSTPAYGRHGTPPTHAFENAIAGLEGGYRAIATSSGVAALSTALAAFVKSGDHIVVQDSVYGPTRKFCDGFLKRFGVETTYMPASQSGDCERFFKGNTKALYLEAPGSLTFEMVDIKALADAAKARGIIVIADNTWATPLGFRSFDYGVNISIHAATKYIVGHSDALLGVLVSDEAHFMPLKKTAALLGHHAAPDDIYLAQRGLRTMALRLRRHAETALALCSWLAGRYEVARILNPAHPVDEGHALWKKHHRIGCGLFGFVLDKKYSYADAKRFVDALKLFGIGFSWGGYESLALALDLTGQRTAEPWTEGHIIRLHAGLEEPGDLQNDLEQAFTALNGGA